MSRTRGAPAAPSNVATHRVAEPAGRIRANLDRRAEVGQERRHPAPDLVDAVGRVAAAVDVDQPLEVGEIGRQVGRDGRPQRVELGRGRGRQRRGHGDRVGHRASLAAGTLLSCPDRASGRDPPARRPERLPAGAGGQGRGRRRPASDLVRAARSRSPRARPPRRERPGPRLAGSRRGGRRLDPPAAPGSRRGPRRPGRPPLVRPGPLDHHLPVARRRARRGPHRGRARPRRARRLAVADGPPDRRPGTAAGALDRADRRRARHAARVAARRRSDDPDRVDLGDQRQEHGDPAHHPHPAAGRPPRRDDDLGRRPRRRADGRSGRLDRAGWRAPDPRPPGRRRGGPRDRARRDRPARRRLRVERRERPDQRLVRSSRPAGHPYAARARRGQVDGLPDHPGGRLGRAQRRRPAGRRGRPPGPGAGGAVHAAGRRRPTSSGGTARGAAAPTSSATACWSRRTAPTETPDRRRRPGPDRDRRTGAPQRRQRARRGRRGAWPRRDDRPGPRRPRSTSPRAPNGRPDGSTCTGSAPSS